MKLKLFFPYIFNSLILHFCYYLLESSNLQSSYSKMKYICFLNKYNFAYITSQHSNDPNLFIVKVEDEYFKVIFV